VGWIDNSDWLGNLLDGPFVMAVLGRCLCPLCFQTS
jgi:hypothetical protein